MRISYLCRRRRCSRRTHNRLPDMIDLNGPQMPTSERRQRRRHALCLLSRPYRTRSRHTSPVAKAAAADPASPVAPVQTEHAAAIRRRYCQANIGAGSERLRAASVCREEGSRTAIDKSSPFEGLTIKPSDDAAASTNNRYRRRRRDRLNRRHSTSSVPNRQCRRRRHRRHRRRLQLLLRADLIYSPERLRRSRAPQRRRSRCRRIFSLE